MTISQTAEKFTQAAGMWGSLPCNRASKMKSSLVTRKASLPSTAVLYSPSLNPFWDVSGTRGHISMKGIQQHTGFSTLPSLFIPPDSTQALWGHSSQTTLGCKKSISNANRANRLPLCRGTRHTLQLHFKWHQKTVFFYYLRWTYYVSRYRARVRKQLTEERGKKNPHY